MKVLKSVNLNLEYVPRCFRNQMQKKVEHKVTSKKLWTFKQNTQNEKVGKMVH